ncbi:MAG: response regulator [Gammaproteobacteria bacterium]|nr:response regulator [Gammaproteobacteria bacterium]
MTLGKKTIALFLVLGTSFTVGIYLALQWTVLPAFEDFERESAEEAMGRVTRALEADLNALEDINVEYAQWSDTHAYAQGLGPEYAEENFDPAYWEGLDIQLLLVFDASGNRMFGRLTDPTDGSNLSLEAELLQPLTSTHPLLNHESTDHFVAGILRTRNGLLEVTSYPILDSMRRGPIAGSFAVGRFLDDERATELSERVTARVSIYPTDQANLPPQVAAAAEHMTGAGELRHSKADENSISQYRVLRDLLDTPVAIIEVTKPRRITQIGADTVQTTMMFLMVASAIFLLAAWLFMQRLIVAPVRQLTEQMLGIRGSGDLRVTVGGNRSDEVGLLAREFGKLTERLGLAQQESEKARLESEKARDQALAMSKTKSEFLARMSHEIRTPMNGVLGMTELLQGTKLDRRQQRFAQTIFESAESLLSIINDILDFSRMEAGKLRLEMLDVDLHNLLEETVDSLANLAYGKGLELINVTPANLASLVKTDPGRLRQVLTNLLGNAIKFTEKGEVALRVSATDIDDENVKVHFEVADTGIGIKPSKQKDIFKSFTQEDGTTTRLYGGTGLGLAISKQLVNLMDGDLTVESTPGKGSKFSFSLNMKKGAESEYLASSMPQFVAGSRILIVDDNETNREILEHQLTGWRAYTDSADSASDALKLLEAAVASGDSYGLAILDMHMPHCDGLQLARIIRDNPEFSELKLIILSSAATPATDEEMAELNVAGQLSKPIRQSQLYDSLVVVLGGEVVAQTHSRLKVYTVKALSGRVLLAEDNAVNQAVAIGMLESMGLSVLVAANGQEAVELAGKEAFDVILMDCQMPKMDGFQAAKAIRAAEKKSERSATPIVAVTANALKGDRERCLAAGMDDYLTKPFTSEQLHSALCQYLQPAATVRACDRGGRQEDAIPVDSMPDQSSPIDSSVLDGLARLQRHGAPSIVQRVIDAYLESSRELSARICDAVDRANAASLRESAHALKSSSANVGAIGLADLCRHLEVMARDNDLSQAPKLRERLQSEYERVVAALKLEAGALTA